MTGPTILLTGATGFLGGATAAQLLQREARLSLLVRAATPEEAEARVLRSLSRFAGPEKLRACRRQWTVLLGDITDALTLADPSLDNVTHVLHLAANTSFRSVRGVRHTNILGTMGLAHRMRRAPRLERFLHVSTAYACGADVPRVVHEGTPLSPVAHHLVEYTSSKAECELLLERTAPELPLVIARPSVVVGHTRLGCRPSASIFWYYRALDLLRRVPVPVDTRKDIVPVDYVADALLLLLLKPGRLRHPIYHISAGEAANVSWREMALAFARWRGDLVDEPYRAVDFPTLLAERARLAEKLGPGDEVHLLQALEVYFRFSACGVEAFDNSRLLAEGMPLPPRFTSYLAVCAGKPSDRSVYQQMQDDD